VAKPSGDYIPPGGFVFIRGVRHHHGVAIGSSDHLSRRCCFHAAVRAVFEAAYRPLDLGLSAERFRRDIFWRPVIVGAPSHGQDLHRFL
jgi:hypothetical protein